MPQDSIIDVRSRRRDSLRPKRMLSALAIVWLVSTFAATVVVDSQVALRVPYVADLTQAYGAKTDPMILAVGSSRTGEGIEINRLTAYVNGDHNDRPLSVFSATVSGSGLVTHETLLNALLANGPTPAAVLLELNAEYLDARVKCLNIKRDLTWNNLTELGDEAFQKFGVRLMVSRLLPVYSQRFEIRRAAWRWAFEKMGARAPKLDPLEPDVPSLSAGYSPSKPALSPMTEVLRTKQIRLASAPLHGFRPTGSAAHALDRMLKKCSDRGIPVLLVDVPLCSHSRQALAPAESQYREYVASLLGRFSNARYFDATALLPDEAFRDHHHANLYGQDLLCRRLGRELMSETLAAWRDKTSNPPDRIAGLPIRSESRNE